MMKTLLDELYAPITQSLRFLNVPLEEAAHALGAWRERLYPGDMQVSWLSERFPEVLHRLEPLTQATYPRELLLRTGTDWTAYFDCGRRGSDAAALGHLSHVLGVRAVFVTTTPRENSVKNPHGRLGSV